MAIDRNAFKENYVRGTSASADKLVNNYIKKSGKLDAAKSDAAEKLYAEKVQQAITKKLRQKGLAKLTEEDLNRGMKATGATNFRTGTAAKAGKMLNNVEPYLSALDGLEGKYPARTADRMQNLVGRAGLVVKTLGDLKDKINEGR